MKECLCLSIRRRRKNNIIDKNIRIDYSDILDNILKFVIVRKKCEKSLTRNILIAR